MRRRALLSAIGMTNSPDIPDTPDIPDVPDVPDVPDTIIDIKDYFTIEALGDGLTASLSVNDCEYCVDGNGVWKTLEAGVSTEAINIGQTLSFRGNLTSSPSIGIGTFTISKNCSVKGNVMSLLFGDDGKYNFSLRGYNYAFYKLFDGQQTVIDASNLILPALTLSIYCYAYMFRNTYMTKTPRLPAETLYGNCYMSMFHNCTKLTTITNLDSTTLANSCYYAMFAGCTSLVEAPELPATTLASYCYCQMFHSCTSLVTVPELPSTTLANGCYSAMFYYCSKLNRIKMLATDISAVDCLYNWVYGVASTGTFVKHKNMTSLPSGTNGIPNGWTVINN